jgi:hypothetical protein
MLRVLLLLLAVRQANALIIRDAHGWRLRCAQNNTVVLRYNDLAVCALKKVSYGKRSYSGLSNAPSMALQNESQCDRQPLETTWIQVAQYGLCVVVVPSGTNLQKLSDVLDLSREWVSELSSKLQERTSTTSSQTVTTSSIWPSCVTMIAVVIVFTIIPVMK